jgi:hypothetical protein
MTFHALLPPPPPYIWKPIPKHPDSSGGLHKQDLPHQGLTGRNAASIQSDSGATEPVTKRPIIYARRRKILQLLFGEQE